MPATATKTARTLKFTPNADPLSPTAGLLEIEARGVRTVYTVTEDAHPDGRNFWVAKVGGEGYDVIVCGRGPDTCTCYAATCGRGCKHRDALRKLVEMGRV